MSGARVRAWRLAGALCGLLVAADQAAKAAVQANLIPGEEVHVIGPLNLTLTHNEGAAFGIGRGGGALLVLAMVAALALATVAFTRRGGQPWVWVPFGLLAGGALGNLADRLRVGAVIDYIDVGMFSWPSFNLADIAITVGVVMFVVLLQAPHGRSDG